MPSKHTNKAAKPAREKNSHCTCGRIFVHDTTKISFTTRTTTRSTDLMTNSVVRHADVVYAVDAAASDD